MTLPTQSEPRYSWTQPICFQCYGKRYPGRIATRVVEAERETCCDCGMDTEMGVYVRVDPATVAHPTREKS